MSPERYWRAIATGVAAMLAAAVIAPLIGSAQIDLGRAFAGASPDYEILVFARLPRTLLALLAGGALAVTGLLFQAILRDSLAEPYTLGISSGSSAGAVAAICFGWNAWLCSSIGALLVMGAVLAIAYENRRLSPFTLLLAGVTMNFVTVAVIVLLHSLSSVGQSFAISRWLMGGLDASEYGPLGPLAAVAIPVCVYLTVEARGWNLLAMGEDWAATRGLKSNRLVLTGYLAGSLLTAAVTAITGPIGFVGLLVPHALRLRFGADHRVLMPLSFLFGGAMLAVCDSIARTVLSPAELPVGVITAFLGGPFFIWLLRRRRMP